MAKEGSKFIILGDVHAPWQNDKVVAAFIKRLEDTSQNPFQYCIQIGDLYDMWSASKFARSHDLLTPQAEAELGRSWAVSFWKQVQKIQPGIKCVQLMGNHDERPMKRILEKCPELYQYFDFKSAYEFEGVRTIQPRTPVMIEGIVFEHGHRSKLGQHAEYNRTPTVVGHSHRGGTYFAPICIPHLNSKKTTRYNLFELNCGTCLAFDSVPARYGMTTITRWTHGWGEIDQYGPRFVSFKG